MKRKVGRTFIIVGALIVAAAAALCCRNLLLRKNATKYSLHKLQELKSIAQMSVTQQRIESGIDEEKDETEKSADSSSGMAEVILDGIAYVGYVSIPTLEIELPIAAELDDDTLLQTPCRYVGSVYMNNLVVAAHNFVGNFGALNKLVTNDEIILTDVNGYDFEYKVAAIEKLKPSSVDKMINSDYDFTLFTCTKGGKFRIAVRCNKIDDDKFIS